jgi:hypothetical protein
MFYNESEPPFDWQRAIARNRDALLPIIAWLVRMLGLDGEDAAERITYGTRRAVLRLLRPAESAVRRLIVVAARGLVAKPVVSRPMPKGRVIRVSRGGSSASRASFQLFDPRKNFAPRPPPCQPLKVLPRILLLDPDPHLVPYRARPQPLPPAPPPEHDGLTPALPLRRRLEALKAALEDLPYQAQRLVQWQARREQQQATRFVFATPLRPGLPPGYRRKPRHEVDDILKECTWLVRYALKSDTS